MSQAVMDFVLILNVEDPTASIEMTKAQFAQIAPRLAQSAEFDRMLKEGKRVLLTPMEARSFQYGKN